MALDPRPYRPFQAYQDTVLDMKRYWTRELYPALEQTYEAKAANVDDAPPKSATDVDALLADEPLAQYFGWLERHLQRMKYSGRLGLAPAFDRDRADIEAALEGPFADGVLELTEGFEQPDYYTAVDIHQHPGGVWSDELAGAVYERGARTTTPLMGRDADLHYRFTDQIFARAGAAKRLLDMGCGFGKSTRPFYTERREMEVTGVDLAEPCLRLAALTATEDQARNVHYRQADAADTGLDDGSVDIVTSTMMLHEMPPKHIRAVLQEAGRVLSPGGLSIHLDFLSEDDPFKRYIHYGHARRNNEPFMPPLNEMDLDEAHRAAGLEPPEIIPFEEMPGTLDAGNTAWRFPWVIIVSRKAA